MPSYDYECDSCGNVFEVFQKMSEEGRADCPKCGAPAHRKLCAVGISFKGDGFYVNDSKKKCDKCESCPKKQQ